MLSPATTESKIIWNLLKKLKKFKGGNKQKKKKFFFFPLPQITYWHRWQARPPGARSEAVCLSFPLDSSSFICSVYSDGPDISLQGNVPWMLNVFPGRSLDITLPPLSRFGLSSTHGMGCKAICELSPPGYLCVGLETVCSQLGRVGETSRSTLGTTPRCASYDEAEGGCCFRPTKASRCPHSTQEYKGITALPVIYSSLFFFYTSERDPMKAQCLSQKSSWREGNNRGPGSRGLSWVWRTFRRMGTKSQKDWCFQLPLGGYLWV